MQRTARLMVLGGLGFYAFACTDAPTKPAKDVLVPLNDPKFAFNGAGQCFGDDAVDFKNLISGMGNNPDDVGCTSNDIDIAIATGVPQGGQPGDPVICSQGQNVTLDLTAFFDQNANSNREDIGVWVATDGGTAISGACNHYYFETNPDGSVAIPGTFNDDLDQCAGMSEQQTATLSLGTLTLPCNIVTIDPDGNGTQFSLGTYLQVGACIGWKVPGLDGNSPVCPDDAAGDGNPPGEFDFRAGTLLANKAKCNCEPFYVPVIVPGNITIIKDAIPNDAQNFDYTTSGDGMSSFTLDDDADNTLSDTKNFTNLDPTVLTPRTVTETVPTGWSVTFIACSGATHSTVLIGGDSDFDNGDNSVSILVASGETVSCTFTNTASSSLDIEKQTIGGTATFGYTVLGGGLAPFSRNTAVNNPTTNAPFTFTGANAVETKYVTETALTGYILTDIACTANGAAITWGTGQGAGFNENATPGFDNGDNTVRVVLTAGDSPTCTFVNTAGSSLDIEKQTIGGTASFDYTVSGGGLAAFSRSTAANNPSQNATFQFTGANAVGTKYVSETPLTGWTLTNIQCVDGEADIVYGTGQGGSFDQNATAGFDPGDNTVQVTLAAGDSPSCVFVNTKHASIDIEKVTYGGIGTFDYVETGPCIPANFSRTTTTAGVATTTAAYDCAPPFTTDQYVQETVPSGWALTNIVCSGTATIVVGSGGSGAFVAGATNNFDTGDNTVKITSAAGSTAACEFRNTKLGSITIVKDAQNPATDPEDFDFATSGTGVSNFTLDDDGGADATNSNQVVFSDLLPGTRTFTEGTETNWALTNRSCTGQVNSVISTAVARQISVDLAAGENVTCTFVNQRLARLNVLKFVVGGNSSQLFDFVRRPDGLLFSLLHNGQQTSGFTLAPNTYRVCELNLAVAWAATGTLDNVPFSLINEDFPLDLGNRCVQAVLNYGDDKTVAFFNTQPPGGDARTIGYWKNWSSCAQSSGKQYTKAKNAGNWSKTLDGNLPQTIGDLVLAGAAGTNQDSPDCLKAVRILDKSDIVSGQKKASDPAYNLAAQLLAAKMNITAGAGACLAATTAIADAQALLDLINFTGTGNYANTMTAAQKTQANALAATLDSYNNNTLCP